MRRQSFQFTVQGEKQTGVVYITKSYETADYEMTLANAMKIAAKRSGDPAPKFIRTVPPVR